MSRLIVDGIKHSSASSNNIDLTSAGKVGIGIASPTGIFAVSDGTRTAEINPHSNGTYIGNRTNHPVLFQINAAEKCRIATDGTFCVGGTVFGAAGAFTVKPNYDDGAAQVITERANTTNVSIVWEMKNNGGQVGRIEHDHTSAGLVSGSDYRLKEKDTPISDGITRVKQLRPIRFNWKAEPSKTVDGFFAHEVQSIVPEAVSGEKDAVDKDNNIIMQGMVTERLVPLLTAALKEAIAKIETLETKVAALEGGG